MLDLENDVKAALASGQLSFAWLVDMPSNDPDSRLYYTDYATPLSVGGTEYLSNGTLLDMPTLVRDGKIKSHSVTINFTGNNAELLTIMASRNMTGEDVRISLVLFDGDGAILTGTPITMFVGTFDGWSFRDGSGGDSISVKVTGPWTKPNLTAGRMTSDGDQMERYSDPDKYTPAVDRFYAYAHIEQDNLGWGKE